MCDKTCLKDNKHISKATPSCKDSVNIISVYLRN